MDGTQFDRWTRRRRIAAAGRIASFWLGNGARSDAASEKGKKSRCRSLYRRALRQKENRCCSGLSCDPIHAFTGLRCCYGRQHPCNDGGVCASFPSPPGTAHATIHGPGISGRWRRISSRSSGSAPMSGTFIPSMVREWRWPPFKGWRGRSRTCRLSKCDCPRASRPRNWSAGDGHRRISAPRAVARAQPSRRVPGDRAKAIRNRRSSDPGQR